jgi:hypothetical protein
LKEGSLSMMERSFHFRSIMLVYYIERSIFFFFSSLFISFSEMGKKHAKELNNIYTKYGEP